jgi:hypothetical protein
MRRYEARHDTERNYLRRLLRSYEGLIGYNIVLSRKLTTRYINLISTSDQKEAVKLFAEWPKNPCIECPYCGKTIVKRKCENCYNTFSQEGINFLIMKRVVSKILTHKYRMILRSNNGKRPKCPNCNKPMGLSKYKYYFLSGLKICSPKRCPRKATQKFVIEENRTNREKREIYNIKSILKTLKGEDYGKRKKGKVCSRS